MKPSWDDAPEWAQWLAMDADGEWAWYELQPSKALAHDFWVGAGRCEAASTNIGWVETLEPRP